jgi:hypothetical protein
VRTRIPLSKRPVDYVFLFFFLLNLLFITYIVDFESLVITNPASFTYPAWPPPFLVDIIHRYGYTFDPLLIARPMWWQMTIWIDVLFFGPFYVFAIYAFVKGREWIRVPSFVYSGLMMANVLIILGEEIAGPHASPQLPIVILLNAPWLLMPIFLIYRMARSEHPFTQEAAQAATSPDTYLPRAPVAGRAVPE